MRRHLLIGAVAATAALVPAGSAAALSCAAHPDGAPASIVAGTEKLATGKPFFEQYDLAIIGVPVGPSAATVSAPATSLPYRATTFRVDAAFGVSEVTSTIVVTSGFPLLPPGSPQIAGGSFTFDPDTTWFVPLKRQGPDGLRNHSFVCDPISAIDRAEIPGLIAGARDGLPVAVPGDAPPKPPPPPGRAQLAIDKSAPASVRPGALLTYEIAVRNTGSATARNVAVIDRLPRGVALLRRTIRHPQVRRRHAAYRRALTRYRTADPDARRAAYRKMVARRSAMRRARFGSRYLPRRSGPSVLFRVGALKPGASRTVRLTVRVRADGGVALANAARARAKNAASVRDTALTQVVDAVGLPTP